MHHWELCLVDINFGIIISKSAGKDENGQDEYCNEEKLAIELDDIVLYFTFHCWLLFKETIDREF
jgi:hypothetical protein